MQKKVQLQPSIKPLFLVAVVAILLIILGSLPVGSTQAQGGPAPTPTDLGSGSDNDDDDDDGDGAPPPPLLAGLSGFVYDYSGGVYEGGVTVLLETDGGWQAEAITDSNGFYQFGGLDSNGGILNLRLPPGVQAAAPDWRVRLVRDSNTEVNLGYYWRDGASIPVRLTASLDGTQLHVQVDNQTSKTATGGLIRIITPSIIRVASPSQYVGATISSYDPHNFQFDVNELNSAATVSIDLPVEANANVDVGQALAEIRVEFTYDQQITPQAVVVNAESLPGLPLAAIERAQSQKPAQVSENNTVVLKGSGAAQAETSTTADTPDNADAFAQPESSSESMDTTTGKEEMLPVTGRIVQPIDTAAFVLSVVVALGLVAGGFLALRDGRVR
ncbi:MAG: hypothetical protein KDJ65_34195 [Anaerolineae bacterium]|nr:hypothetical protein [Anaerolineae bacterium]